MGKLDFSIKLDSPIEKLIPMIMNFEMLPTILPRQLKSVKILEESIDGIKTEEILVFKTLVKNEIKQTSLHKKVSNNCIHTEILSGPAAGTNIKINLEKYETNTDVCIEIDLKLSFKAKFLSPIIMKVYKHMLTGVFLKIDNLIIYEKK